MWELITLPFRLAWSVLTVAWDIVWGCVSLAFGLVGGIFSLLLGVAVLITYSPQNGIILMILAFLISPFGLPKAAIWMLGKVQDLKYAIQDKVYG